jgi:hypothetical protein
MAPENGLELGYSLPVASLKVGEAQSKSPKLRGRIFSQIYSAVLHTNTRENNGNDGVPTPASFIWTTAIQSGSRDARRYQSHQRTQGNVLWQRGGRGRLRGWCGRFVVAATATYTV